jgi:hypothetical protein
MRLRLLSALFQLSAVLAALTLRLHRRADSWHAWAWRACTKENLRTLKVSDRRIL